MYPQRTATTLVSTVLRLTDLTFTLFARAQLVDSAGRKSRQMENGMSIWGANCSTR
jgi:hypothetical protein